MAMKSIIFKGDNLEVTKVELGIIETVTSIEKIFVEGDTINFGLICNKETADYIVSLLGEIDENWYFWDGEWTDEDEEYYQQELAKSQSEYPIEYEHEDNKIVQFSENLFTAYVYADPFDDECEDIIEEAFKSLDEAKSYIDNHLKREYIECAVCGTECLSHKGSYECSVCGHNGYEGEDLTKG